MIIGDFVEVKIVFKKEMIENVIKESSIKNDEKEICIEVNFKLLFYQNFNYYLYNVDDTSILFIKKMEVEVIGIEKIESR